MSPFTFTLLLIGIIMYGVYRIAKLGVEKQDENYSEDDGRTMQEIYKGLTRMEKRIDSLETILADRIERPAKTFDEVREESEFIIR